MTKIHNIKILSIVLLIAMLATACFKQPVYDDTPEIAFKAFEYDGSEYTIGDTGYLKFTFTDGDGDIGKVGNDDSSVVNTKNLIIQTNYTHRAPFTDTLNLPEVPYNGTTDDISGEISVRLTTIYDDFEIDLLPIGVDRDTVTMTIYIKDRAGHISNGITTPKLPRYFP